MPPTLPGAKNRSGWTHSGRLSRNQSTLLNKGGGGKHSDQHRRPVFRFSVCIRNGPREISSLQNEMDTTLVANVVRRLGIAGLDASRLTTPLGRMKLTRLIDHSLHTGALNIDKHLAPLPLSAETQPWLAERRRRALESRRPVAQTRLEDAVGATLHRPEAELTVVSSEKKATAPSSTDATQPELTPVVMQLMAVSSPQEAHPTAPREQQQLDGPAGIEDTGEFDVVGSDAPHGIALPPRQVEQTTDAGSCRIM